MYFQYYFCRCRRFCHSVPLFKQQSYQQSLNWHFRRAWNISLVFVLVGKPVAASNQSDVLFLTLVFLHFLIQFNQLFGHHICFILQLGCLIPSLWTWIVMSLREKYRHAQTISQPLLTITTPQTQVQLWQKKNK